MESWSVLWRRLDVPGHDACRLARTERGWELEGTAVFRHGSEPALLTYRVTCDRAWNSERGLVSGWIAQRRIDRRIEHAPGGPWMLDGVPVEGVDDCIDLDLGFTPATNLVIVRRLALGVGESADAPAAWLDDDVSSLHRLAQRYSRRSEHAYDYQSPQGPYSGVLEVDATGFLRRYPGLWVAES